MVGASTSISCSKPRSRLQVIGDVRPKYVLRPFFTDHDAVLLVPEIGGAEPLRPVLLVDDVVLPQTFEGASIAAFSDSCARRPSLVANAESSRSWRMSARMSHSAELERLAEAVVTEQFLRAGDHCIDVDVLVAGVRRPQVPEDVSRRTHQRATCLLRPACSRSDAVVATVAVARERELLAEAFE